MPSRERLLEQAKRSPSNMQFSDVCHLAEAFGFVFARQQGSHRMYKYPGRRELMNFQEQHGKAKEYQVKQLVRAIEEITAQSDVEVEE